MTQQGVRWTADQVLALAPDAASRKAGSKLGAAGPWSGAGSRGRGRCGGCARAAAASRTRRSSTSRTAGPRTSAVARAGSSRASTRWGCCCSGRAGDGRGAGAAQAPDWAEQWLAGRAGARRSRSGRRARPAPRPGRPIPEAARRRAERRAERITAGATELEQRLADLLRGGLAAAEQAGYGLWEETAARMVDAQAPGLAGAGAGVGGDPGVRAGLAGAAAGGVRAAAPARPGLAAARAAAGRRWPRRSAPGSACPARRGRPAGPGPLAGPRPVRHGGRPAHHPPDLAVRRASPGRTALLLSFGAAGRAPELALPVGLALRRRAVRRTRAPGQLRAALGERFGAARARRRVRPAGR